MDSIGETIKKHRLKMDMTQEELGKKMFVTKQAVSKWENSKTLPDIETIKKLVDILSIPHDEILGDTINQAQKSRRIIKFLIPVLVASVLLTLFFSFDGFGYIQRKMQSGVAIVTLFENDELVKADNYRVIGLYNFKPGDNGYSFAIDYGNIKGKIITSKNEEIEFGFVNTNNWHNVQITVRINDTPYERNVIQTVIYKTEDGMIDVLETKSAINEDDKVSVYREGI